MIPGHFGDMFGARGWLFFEEIRNRFEDSKKTRHSSGSSTAFACRPRGNEYLNLTGEQYGKLTGVN